MKLINLEKYTTQSLKKMYQAGKWKEKDLIKYWIFSHKEIGLPTDLIPMTWKVRTVLRKFLTEVATSDLPDVIDFAVDNLDELIGSIEFFNGSLISFCYNYGRIYRKYKSHAE